MSSGSLWRPRQPGVEMVPYSSAISGTGTTGDATWVRWNNIYTMATGTSTCVMTSDNSENPTIWRTWNNDWTSASNASNEIRIYNTGATTTSNQIWTYWNDQWQQTHVYPMPLEETQRRQGQLEHLQGQGLIRPVSAEQREQWQREDAERRRVAEEHVKKLAEEQAMAKERAEKLLRSCLSPQQQDELERLHHFHLIVGNKKYRINRGRSRNIQLIDETGKVVKHLCAHPREYVPDADTMLAQKLMLETDEESFLKIANHS